MRLKRIGVLTVIAIALFAGAAAAQKKPVKKTPVKKSPVKVIPPLEVRAGREKVDVQLSNVNEFEKKLATIAQGLEVADADAQAGRLKPETAAKIKAKKSEIVDAIHNIRDAMTKLESEFRTKVALQKYLPTLTGISDLAARSEDLAITGKFVLAKDPLREISKKLTDTLTAMPL